MPLTNGNIKPECKVGLAPNGKRSFHGIGRASKSALLSMRPSAPCIGGYDDNNNVASGDKDQSTDSANLLTISAYARNEFAAAISFHRESARGQI